MATDIVIAGGGLAAQRATETLRARGHDGPIRIVCGEAERPYDRPPLSKGFLTGAQDDPAFRPAGWYAEHDVDLLLGTRATGLDGRRLLLDDGSSLPFGELLIATGARARALPGGGMVLRTLADARALGARLAPGARLVVVGAGFVGLEVAATARSLGVDVVVLDALPVPLARVLPPQLGSWFARMHAAKGVRLELGVRIATVADGAVTLEDGRVFRADAVLVAIGVQPDAGWAGFPRGVPVDEAGRSPLPHVWAAGDATGSCDHWEPAARQGLAVARAMLGLDVPDAPPTSFWTDQYDVRIQLVGSGAGADSVDVDGSLAERDFTAVLRRGGRTTGVLLAARPLELPKWRRRLAALDVPRPERSAA